MMKTVRLTKIKQLILARYSRMIVVVILVYFGYLGWYMYQNVYTVVFQDHAIDPSSLEISKGVLNEKQFESMIQKIQVKEKTKIPSEISALSNPFGEIAEETTNEPGVQENTPVPR